MNVRDAILKAADHIEQNPRLFRFSEYHQPGDCGSPGCALGWIGFFHGLRSDKGGVPMASDIAHRVFGFNKENGKPPEDEYDRSSCQQEFYNRLDKICSGNGWRYDASVCACALRLYADKYHPAEAKQPDDSEAFTRFLGKINLGKVAA